MTANALDLATVRRTSPAERRRIREEARLSRSDIARELGCTETSIRSWEIGDRTPSGALGARYGRLLHDLADLTADAAEAMG